MCFVAWFGDSGTLKRQETELEVATVKIFQRAGWTALGLSTSEEQLRLSSKDVRRRDSLYIGQRMLKIELPNRRKRATEKVHVTA